MKFSFTESHLNVRPVCWPNTLVNSKWKYDLISLSQLYELTPKVKVDSSAKLVSGKQRVRISSKPEFSQTSLLQLLKWQSTCGDHCVRWFSFYFPARDGFYIASLSSFQGAWQQTHQCAFRLGTAKSNQTNQIKEELPKEPMTTHGRHRYPGLKGGKYERTWNNQDLILRMVWHDLHWDTETTRWTRSFTLTICTKHKKCKGMKFKSLQ